MAQLSSDQQDRTDRNQWQWPVVMPLTFAVLASVLIRLFDVDRKVSELNYDAARHFWPCERADPWLSFYRYGTYPPVMLGLAGGLLFLFARWMWPAMAESRLRSIRQQGLFLLLMLLIGPGLIVNVGLKELCGRPRPLQCQEFGGELAFRHVGEIAAHRFPNSSFPSGHAAVAFFMMAPAFVISANQYKARRAWIAAGILYGLAMGFTRVLQGGHFVSDVLWAGIIVYLVAVGLARLLFQPSHENRGTDPFSWPTMVEGELT